MQRRADASPAADGELRRLRADGRLLLVTAPFEEAARRLGLLEPGGLERCLADADGPRGRANTAVLALAERTERLHLRPLHHGGMLGGLLRDWWLGVGRPAGELHVTACLRGKGAPVPRPVLVAARRLIGPVWKAAVGTVYAEGSQDGERFLENAPEGERLLRACSAAGRAVRLLHDAGGRHRDLHLKNLLVVEAGKETQVLVVDLDRARAVDPPGASARMAEIMRLYRSLVKRGLDARVGRVGHEAFLDAYTGGDGDLRRALLRYLPRERRRLALRRLGWGRLPG